jgi:hypothetical protein
VQSGAHAWNEWIPIGNDVGADPEEMTLKEKLLDQMIAGEIHPSEFHAECKQARARLRLIKGITELQKASWQECRLKFPALTSEENLSRYLSCKTASVEDIYRSMALESAKAQAQAAAPKLTIGMSVEEDKPVRTKGQ